MVTYHFIPLLHTLLMLNQSRRGSLPRHFHFIAEYLFLSLALEFLQLFLVKAEQVGYNIRMSKELDDLRQKAREMVEGRLAKAANLTEADLFQMNLTLPPDYKYQSIREIQTVMVKGAFDALGFSVELGLLDKQEATAFWQQLHSQYRSLWPETSHQ